MSWTGILISIAVFQQNIESLFIPPPSWSIVKDEIPRILRPLIEYSRGLSLIQVAAALLSLWHPHWVLALAMALGTWANAIRWRGTFNGGSDRMTFIVLIAWTWALARPASEILAVRLIALELSLSYFVAGLAKLGQSEWRRGRALARFLPLLGDIPQPMRIILSVCIMSFETTFPLAVINSHLAAVYLTMGFIFHLMNTYTLGLNRFFFAWIAAYPALLLASKV